MRPNDLQSALISHTADTSPHEARREYIGLSGIGDCPSVIYDRFVFGNRHTNIERLKDTLCYDLEHILVARLTQMGIYTPARPISLFDGLVRGHPDGVIGDELLEIKTIERAEWIPEPPRLPNRVFYQVQAYMHYGGFERGHVLYLARDTGEIRVIGVTRHISIVRRIEERVATLIHAVHNRKRPECSCGRGHTFRDIQLGESS